MRISCAYHTILLWLVRCLWGNISNEIKKRRRAYRARQYMRDISTRVLPGFMELLPEEQLEFERIKSIIAEEYRRFGFTPLDTPVIERTETLLAKAGGETEKQMYRFNKGDTDLSLRFDLTVPLARYVAEHFNDLTFPFKRQQIGKVYRGERSQKGRFREFYQCDIDVIGRDNLSIFYDAEMPAVIYSIFKRLDFGKFTIRLNNRKILSGFLENINATDLSADVLRIIDKSEKISKEDMLAELQRIGLDERQIEALLRLTALRGQPDVVVPALQSFGIKNDLFQSGVDELVAVTHAMQSMGVLADYFVIDVSIARGLDYYTGTIYETTLDGYPGLGSVCSGGRYDNLTKYYTEQTLPGVGISIGLTRLFHQLQEAGIVQKRTQSALDVLVLPLGPEQALAALQAARQLRASSLNTDVLLQDISTKNRFKYADRTAVESVIVIGEEEAASGQLTLQNMVSGSKEKLSIEQIITRLHPH